MTYIPPLDRCMFCCADGDAVNVYFRGELICRKCIDRLFKAEAGWIFHWGVSTDSNYHLEPEVEERG